MAALCPICHGPRSIGQHPCTVCERVRIRRLQEAERQDAYDRLVGNIGGWYSHPAPVKLNKETDMAETLEERVARRRERKRLAVKKYREKNAEKVQAIIAQYLKDNPKEGD